MGYAMVREPAEEIRILIVDDHPVVRTGLASMLATQENFRVVGSASTGAEALAMIPQLSPDIMLLDLRMPDMNGIETLQAIHRLPAPPFTPPICTALSVICW